MTPSLFWERIHEWWITADTRSSETPERPYGRDSTSNRSGVSKFGSIPWGGKEGTPDERNHDYAIGLQRLLRLLSVHQASITDITVDSERMMKKSPDPTGRQLNLPFPIHLHSEVDFVDLWHRIGAAQRVVGSEATTTTGGNRTRLICLTIDIPGVVDRSRLLSILGH